MGTEFSITCTAPRSLLADDRIIYWAISDAMPATGRNPRPMKLAGQKVTAAGKVFERGGSRTMVVEKIRTCIH